MKLQTILILEAENASDMAAIRELVETLNLVRGFLPFGYPSTRDGKAGIEGRSVRSWLGPIAVPGQFVTAKTIDDLIQALESAARSVRETIEARTTIAPADVLDTYPPRIDQALRILRSWSAEISLDEEIRLAVEKGFAIAARGRAS